MLKGIPPHIHYIWLGSTLPITYALGIIKVKDFNPDYTINLWYSREILSKEDNQKMEEFASKNNLKLRCIKDEIVLNQSHI